MEKISIILDFNLVLLYLCKQKFAVNLIRLLKANFFSILGILIDSFILQHNWEAFKEADLSLQLSYDIRNSKTGIGLMFSGKKWEKWATFLRGFFTENQDAESRFLKEAIDRSKQKVNIISMQLETGKSNLLIDMKRSKL